MGISCVSNDLQPALRSRVRQHCARVYIIAVPLRMPPYACALISLLLYSQRQHLDVHAGSRHRSQSQAKSAAATARDLLPVVVFVHGGAWTWGHKWQYSLLCHELAKLGVRVCLLAHVLQGLTMSLCACNTPTARGDECELHCVPTG